MFRKSNAQNEKPLRTLLEDELTSVAGGHPHPHHRGPPWCEDVQQTNISNTYQIVYGDVSGSLTMISGTSQGNSVA